MNKMLEISGDIMDTLDNSNLLRGLLILVVKDKNIWDHEASIFIKEGMKLGYEKEFCEESINNALRNTNINQEPPIFFRRANALKFLKIACRIIKEDIWLNQNKIQFLEKVSSLNGLSRHWQAVGQKLILKNNSPFQNINSDNFNG